MAWVFILRAISAEVGDFRRSNKETTGQLHSSSPQNQILPHLVGAEICTVTATTKITTIASLSTARLYHPVTCSGR